MPLNRAAGYYSVDASSRNNLHNSALKKTDPWHIRRCTPAAVCENEARLFFTASNTPEKRQSRRIVKRELKRVKLSLKYALKNGGLLSLYVISRVSTNAIQPPSTILSPTLRH